MDIDSVFDRVTAGAGATGFAQALGWLGSGPACVALLGADGYTCLYANPACTKLLGEWPLAGRGFFDVLPALEGQGARRLFDRILGRGRPFSARGRKVRLDQGGMCTLHHFDVVLQPVRGAAGNMLGLLLQCCATTRSLPSCSGRDVLTGLADHASFRDAVDQALAGPAGGADGMVVALDVGRFHRVNACAGREGGDRILCDLAARLSGAAGTHAMAAREGANRFLFLFDEADAQVPAALLGALEAPFHHDGTTLYLDARVGFVRLHGQERCADQVLASLDYALAAARRAGPGAIRDGTHAGRLERERARMAGALRAAIDGNGIEVHYQPQVDLASGGISGVEALVRWNDALMGPVPADTIVRVAEEAGLIGRLGDRVLRIACAQAQAWRDMGCRELRVAVNLSARQVQMQSLERTVLDALEESGLPPACLDLELTESVVMDDVAQALSCLQNLKRHGVQLSLDDFGTGYSSLAYLRQFPIDTLKLDRSFLELVPGNARAAGLVSTIIASVHGLGIRVIAEGVEHEAQLRFLARSGCDEIQGYFFSRPLAAPQMTVMLLARQGLPEPLRRRSLRVPAILLVDADRERRCALGALAARLLERGGRVLYTASAAEAIRMFTEAPDLIVIAPDLPDMPRTAFLRIARQLCPGGRRILLAGATPLPVDLAEPIFAWPSGCDALLEHMRVALAGAAAGI